MISLVQSAVARLKVASPSETATMIAGIRRLEGTDSDRYSDGQLLARLARLQIILEDEEKSPGSGMRELGVTETAQLTPEASASSGGGMGRSARPLFALPSTISIDRQRNLAEYNRNLNHFSCDSKGCAIDRTINFHGSIIPYYNTTEIRNERINGDAGFTSLNDTITCTFNGTQLCAAISFFGYGNFRQGFDTTTANWNGGSKVFTASHFGCFTECLSAVDVADPAYCGLTTGCKF